MLFINNHYNHKEMVSVRKCVGNQCEWMISVLPGELVSVGGHSTVRPLAGHPLCGVEIQEIRETHHLHIDSRCCSNTDGGDVRL